MDWTSTVHAVNGTMLKIVTFDARYIRENTFNNCLISLPMPHFTVC
jgi:hypothetical protein